MNKLFTFFKSKNLIFFILSLILISGIVFFTLILSCQKETKKKVIKKNYSVEIKKTLTIADSLYDYNKLDSSFYYYNKAMLLCNPEINCDEYVYSLSSMADIQTIIGDYTTSEQTLIKTLPYLSKVKKVMNVRNVYGYIAINYLNTYNYKDSFLYHKKALDLPGTSFKKTIVLIDIAVLYMKEKRYKEAISILEPLSRIKRFSKKRSLTNNSIHANIISNLGLCYYHLQKPKAVELYNASINIYQKLNEGVGGLFLSYLNLSIYYENKNPKLAQKYAKIAYANAAPSDKANGLAQLIKTSEGNTLKKYTSDYIKIIDSTTLDRRSARNQFAQIKYNSEEDKVENLDLKVEKAENELLLQRQKNRSTISYIIITFSIIALFFLYFYLTSKRKKTKIEAIYESETRIAKKLRAELSDNVYQTTAFAKITDLEQKENKEKLLLNLDQIYSKTRNISKENSLIKTDKNYPKDLKEMISDFKTVNLNILLNGLDTINWNEIEKNQKIIVYRVLQELFINMKKYNNSTLVSVSFKILSKNMSVIYIDNRRRTSNYGQILKNDFQNVENRIKTINGTITFDNNSEKGLKISFTFPL
ncbi:tetratricopeptide repeat-containing sensor histidine kinase [Flavobacterium branchiicola]|uniref:ATP-binding protein n=1 Tax=Flavobacterium branchiicola TaxID=1114875 RepID=A0ABV9PGP4_9FLAO|nr:tetratricopeptide repeat-containing sensor histidine kinase [Flavobacterium branchiicola]MBS7255744.1 ATP-binding protein [Flavobacterium branchiicola]